MSRNQVSPRNLVSEQGHVMLNYVGLPITHLDDIARLNPSWNPDRGSHGGLPQQELFN